MMGDAWLWNLGESADLDVWEVKQGPGEQKFTIRGGDYFGIPWPTRPELGWIVFTNDPEWEP